MSDWSADVCASDLSASPFLRSVGACILPPGHRLADLAYIEPADLAGEPFISLMHSDRTRRRVDRIFEDAGVKRDLVVETQYAITHCNLVTLRSEEHTSELQSLMRISYAVFCLKKKIQDSTNTQQLPILSSNSTNYYNYQQY